ncbi:MAG: hypothetical protein ACKVI4_07140 [Actinomycetales bacterium]
MSRYAGVQDIYEALAQKGLLESQGHQVFPKDVTPGAESAQGVLYSRSLFSDMEVASYYIEIFYLEGQSCEANTQQIHQARADDESALVALAAESWCAILTRGDVDAHIPGNIADLVLEALGEGEIVWSRLIPEAEWFTPPFANTGDLLTVLESREFGFHRRSLDDAAWLASADPYIHECIAKDDGSFALGLLDVVTKSGEAARLLVDLFVEEQMADYLTTVFPSYFPIARPNNTIADNGWLIRVSQDHAKLATSYDLEDAANLIRAALFPAEGQEEASAQRVYTYYTNDGGEHGIFGCRAETEYEAEKLVRAAGHREYLLFDNRELEAHETSAAATERILENPFLGALWVPLVDAIDVATGYLRPGVFWTLDCYSRAHNYNAYASPFAQAILEHDGSLHIEVCGRNDKSNPIVAEQLEALEFLGWAAPALPEEVDIGVLPNPWRVLDAGWNGRRVAELILEALTIVYRVVEADLFNFGESLEESLTNLGTLERIDGPIFGIPNTRPSRAAEQTAVAVAEAEAGPSKLPPEPYPFGLSNAHMTSIWAALDAIESGDLGESFDTRDDFLLENFGNIPFSGLPELLALHPRAAHFASRMEKLTHLLEKLKDHPPANASMSDIAMSLDEFILSRAGEYERELPFLSDVSLRVIAALSRSDHELLSALAWDTCSMVRFAAAGNPDTPADLLISLRGDPVWEVREEARKNRAAGVSSSSIRVEQLAVARLAGADCACGSDSASEQMMSWFRRMKLVPPFPPAKHLSLMLAQQSELSWATQPMPLAMDDYMFSTVDYLRGPVPDQFAVSHAGHGANSYSINLRVVLGQVALLAQSSWGGAFTDPVAAAESWQEVRSVYLWILRRTEKLPSSKAHVRERVVTYSNFRGNQWTVERLVDGRRVVEKFDSGDAMVAAHFPRSGARPA